MTLPGWCLNDPMRARAVDLLASGFGSVELVISEATVHSKTSQGFLCDRISTGENTRSRTIGFNIKRNHYRYFPIMFRHQSVAYIRSNIGVAAHWSTEYFAKDEW